VEPQASLHLEQPATVVRRHRQGFKYCWRWKSRYRGRPKIDPELRHLIQRVCQANALWGAPRVHGELIKLKLDLSEETVSKDMVRYPGPPSQTWRTFLHNHVKETVSLDFFTVPTATFKILFVFLVLNNDRRRIVHFNVAAQPTAEWTARQLVEASGFDENPQYLIRDRDAIYGERYRRQAEVLGIDEVVIARRSPWQNPYVEQVIGSIRRDCVEHVLVLGQRHLMRILSEHMNYYNSTRTHISLAKSSPEGRSIQMQDRGRIVSDRRVGGLHHEYCRIAA